ncbi:phage tail protein [Flavobacterium nitrogenifigens]|uniref:Microcystin-dependent protein n=1 Tax=Flavobacterium nitrogenifigens TaxID=1617283 RepID=A0A521F493_9FLAO|nr:tail fiber protein [Flavobacterium nitrogenifigens]KAF2339704.1 phage tail protein [Flavobacterium nitrogenifigens]SMO90959.1 Microcystin-dependent protein [Flavobacterium nitrogenifigens]
MEGTVSEIRLFAPNFAPKNWAFCYGQILNISTNQALFSLLGTTFGGNGVQTFCLPDFRGRIPAGTGIVSGLAPFQPGTVMGTNSVTALLSNLPNHNHAASGSFAMPSYSDTGDSSSATNNTLAILQGLYSNKAANAALKPVTPTITVNLTGNNQPISVQQPYLGMNYIICLQGVFPSRN